MTEQENLPAQPFIHHMLELRDRLLRTFIAILILFACLFPLVSNSISISQSPLEASYLNPRP